jgi:hypothetical protein
VLFNIDNCSVDRGRYDRSNRACTNHRHYGTFPRAEDTFWSVRVLVAAVSDVAL